VLRGGGNLKKELKMTHFKKTIATVALLLMTAPAFAGGITSTDTKGPMSRGTHEFHADRAASSRAGRVPTRMIGAFMDGTVVRDRSYSASSNHRSDDYSDYRPRSN
jgi:hypothetical protein